MVEYTVGSLADLISGKDTPGKQAIVKKNYKPPIQTEEEPSPPKKKPKKNKIKQQVVNGDTNSALNKSKKKNRPNHNRNIEIENAPVEKKSKKRKQSTDSRPQKKQKKIVEADNEEPEETEQNDDVQKPDAELTNDEESDSDDEESSIKKRAKEGKATNAEKRILSKNTKNKYAEKDALHEEYRGRTLFVGNVNINVNKNKLKQFFSKFGRVETVRLRSVPLASVDKSRKVAVIQKQFHPNRHSANAYVRYLKDEDAKKALAANGKEFMGHHLRVNMAADSEESTRDESKAIFVGNLNFKTEEEDLWKLFSNCGEIQSVRIIRDRATNISKCFGYVNFKDPDAVSIALTETFNLHERELRIRKCDINHAKKEKRKNKVLKKKDRARNVEVTEEDTEENGEPIKKKKKKDKKANRENENTNISENSHQSFQGVKRAEKKKKKKMDRGLQKKKSIAKKLIPKPAA